MNRRFTTLCIALAIFGNAMPAGENAAYAEESANPWPSDSSPGLTALYSASQQGRYTFVFFWKEANDHTQRMQGQFHTAMDKMPKPVEALSVHVADPKEQATVEVFGVDRAPLPMVVAVAPNGAITKAWPLEFREDQLQSAIVSHSAAECLKGLQDRKLVLLSIQNGKTAHNQSAQQAAAGFKADARFASATRLVSLDPTDLNESAFLHSLQVNPQTQDAVTILLAPPGRPIARFDGAVTTADLVAKLTSAQSGCCPDGQCGPDGCCPKPTK